MDVSHTNFLELDQKTPLCNLQVLKFTNFIFCLLARSLLLIGPLLFYDYGATFLVIFYMMIFIIIISRQIYLNIKYTQKQPLLQFGHLFLYKFAFLFSVLSLWFPVWHIVSIFISIDICLSVLNLIAFCPYAKNPELCFK